MTIDVVDLRAKLRLDSTGVEAGEGRARAALGRFSTNVSGIGSKLKGIGSAAQSGLGKAGKGIEAIGSKSKVADRLISHLGLSSGVTGDVLESGLGAGAIAAGAGLALGLGEGLKSWLDLSNQVREFKEISGATAEESSGLISVMKQLDIPVETGARAFFLLGKAVAGHEKTLKGLGIEVARNKDGNVELTDTLFNVSDAYLATEDPAKRAQIAAAAFGRSGAKLIPILERGREGLKEFFDEAKKHHEILTDEDLDKALQFRLSMDRLKSAVSGLGRETASGLAPALTVVLGILTDILEQADKIIGPVEKIAEKVVHFAFPVREELTGTGAAGIAAAEGLSNVKDTLDAVDGSASAAGDSINEFSTDVTGAQDPLKALITKIQGPGALAGVLKDLVARGLPKKLAKQLKDMGPPALEALNELADGTDEDLGRFVKILQKAMPAAHKQIKVFAGLTSAELKSWSRDLTADLNFASKNLNDLANDPKLNPAKIVKFFDDQGKAERDYAKNFNVLIRAKLPSGLLKQIADLGSDGATLVDQLANSNKSQFKRIKRDWDSAADHAPDVAHAIQARFAAHPVKVPLKLGSVFSAKGERLGKEVSAGLDALSLSTKAISVSASSVTLMAGTVSVNAPHHALGGHAAAGELGVFGEKGIELGVPDTGMNILTAEQTRRLLGGRSSGGFSATFVIHASEPKAVGREVEQVIRKIAREEFSAEGAQSTRLVRLNRG